MKAILESIHSDWDIQAPYVEWKEHPQHNMTMKGSKFPKGKDIIPIHQEPGRASVTVNIEFQISGDPKGKENDFTHKLMLLLEEIEV